MNENFENNDVNDSVIDETSSETVNEVISEAVNEATADYSDNTVSGVETAPKKKTGAKIAAIGVGAVVLLGGGGVAAYNLSDFVKNQVKLATLDAPEYYAWVMEENASKTADSAAESYSAYLDALDDGQSAGVKLQYEVSDAVKTWLLEGVLGTEYEATATDDTQAYIDFVNSVSSIAVGMDADAKGNVMTGSVYGNFNGENVLTVDMAVDAEALKCYYRIPELTEKWLGVDMATIMEESGTDVSLSETMDSLTKNPEEILSASELEDIITRYGTVWNNEFEKVELEKKEKLDIGDISVEYTAITADVNGKTAYDIANAFLTELKDDELVKEIVTERLEMTSADEYDTLISEAVSSLEAEKDSMYEDDTTVELVTYVDAKGVIRGISFQAPDEEGGIDFIIGLEDDNVYGEFTLDMADEGVYSAVLNAVKNKDAYTGDIEVFAGSESVASIEFTDFEVVDEEKGYANGTVTLVIPEVDPISLTLSSDGKSQDITLALNIEGTDYGKVTLSLNSDKIDDVAMPDVSNAFMLENQDSDLEGYVTEEEINTFITNLCGKLGIEEEYAQQLIDSMSGSDDYIEDDYIYEDDYDWTDDEWTDDTWIDDELTDDEWTDDEWETEAENPYMDSSVEAASGQAYLNVMDYSWEAEYWGYSGESLSFNAGVADITGNGQYTVSVTADTDGYRFATTGDAADASMLPYMIDYLSVCIVDGPELYPGMTINIDSVVIDGKEYPITGKCYTADAFYETESLIYCEWEEVPEDARCSDGDISSASTMIIDASAIEEWTTIEVKFTVSGIA